MVKKARMWIGRKRNLGEEAEEGDGKKGGMKDGESGRAGKVPELLDEIAEQIRGVHG